MSMNQPSDAKEWVPTSSVSARQFLVMDQQAILFRAELLVNHAFLHTDLFIGSMDCGGEGRRCHGPCVSACMHDMWSRQGHYRAFHKQETILYLKVKRDIAVEMAWRASTAAAEDSELMQGGNSRRVSESTSPQ